MENVEYAERKDIDLLRQDIERLRNEVELKLEKQRLDLRRLNTELQFGFVDRSVKVFLCLIVVIWVIVVTVLHLFPNI